MANTRNFLIAAVLVVPGRPLSGQHVVTGFLDRVVTVGGHTYRYQVFVPAAYGDSLAYRWPVILFLHGAGERGTDGLRQTQVGLGSAMRRDPGRFPAIAVFPQAPPDSLWVGIPAQMAMAALEHTLNEFRTAADRVYLTGLSMGGNGAWYLAYRYPDRFAAVVPICGWITPLASGFDRGFAPVVPPDSGPPLESLARRLRRLPIWLIHGEADPVIPVAESRRAAAALQSAGATVRYTELLGTDHNAWDAAYGSAQVTTWLFAQSRRP